MSIASVREGRSRANRTRLIGPCAALALDEELIMVAEELMSKTPYVVSVKETIRRVMAKLVESDVRHLPVVDEGRLVGMVSDRDLHRLVDPMFELAAPSDARRQDLEQPISALMSSDVISVNPESELDEVIDLMIDHKIGAVPVTEADSSKLLGIISYVDVLRAARDVL
jgi:CBS domain-containing protein